MSLGRARKYKEFSSRSLSRRRVLLGLGGGAALLATGASQGAGAGTKASAYPAEVATSWFSLVLTLIRTTTGYSPPVASRALGYLGLALYEAVVPGMPGLSSLGGKLPQFAKPRAPHPKSPHWPTVANATLAAMCRTLFATSNAANIAAIDALEQHYAAQYAGELGPGKFELSRERGARIAAHVLAYSRSDGGHEAYLNNFPASYVRPVGPGLWEPTPDEFQPALLPFWGSKRAFALPTNDAFDPGPPTPYSPSPKSAFYAEALEVHAAVNKATPEQRAIAQFWSDDPGETATPPGHSMSILNQILAQTGARLDVAVEAYAKLGLALADAFVSCWETKYRYNLLRPVTYIRDHIDRRWSPLLSTPPFPEYTSGHSVQAGAFAQVMNHLFGPLSFTDRTHDAIGLAPRKFADFFAAAHEAAISRLYGGIHFLPAIELGVVQGFEVGQAVLDLPWSVKPASGARPRG